jgi:hypothetical protein
MTLNEAIEFFNECFGDDDTAVRYHTAWQTLKSAVLAAQTNNSAMDAIATITRAVSDNRLEDYTKVLMVKDALKWRQLHQ